MNFFDASTHNNLLNLEIYADDSARKECIREYMISREWQGRGIRSAINSLYDSHYRLADYPRSLLCFAYDILPDDEVSFPSNEMHSVDEDFISEDSIRAYIAGVFNRKTGIHSYTIPNNPIRSYLFDAAWDNRLISELMMKPHNIDRYEIQMLSNELGIKPQGSIQLFKQSFDGLFIHEDSDRVTIAQLHHVYEDEEFYRVRLSSFRYDFENTYNSMLGNIKRHLKWDFAYSWDGVLTGIGSANAHLLLPSSDQSGSYWMREVSNFKFDNKNRRCQEFTEITDHPNCINRIYRRVQMPDDVQRTADLLNSVNLFTETPVLN